MLMTSQARPRHGSPQPRRQLTQGNKQAAQATSTSHAAPEGGWVSRPRVASSPCTESPARLTAPSVSACSEAPSAWVPRSDVPPDCLYCSGGLGLRYLCTRAAVAAREVGEPSAAFSSLQSSSGSSNASQPQVENLWMVALLCCLCTAAGKGVAMPISEAGACRAWHNEPNAACSN